MGGVGVHGILEVGCSVVLLCFDEHRRTHLQTSLLERSVEAMVVGTSLVFKDAEFQARSVHLNLAPPPKAVVASAKSEADLGEKKLKPDKKEEKGKKNKGKPEEKEDKSEKKSDSESSSSTSSSSESPPPKKRKKKA